MAAGVVVGEASSKPLRSADISPSFRHRQAGGPSQDQGFQDRKDGVSAHKARSRAAAHKVAGDTEVMALSAKHQTVLAPPSVPIRL